MWNLAQPIRKTIDMAAIVLMVILILILIPSVLINFIGIDHRLSVLVALIAAGLYMWWAIPEPRTLFPTIFVSVLIATAISFWASSTAIFTLGFILSCIVNIAVVCLVAAGVIFGAKIRGRVGGITRWVVTKWKR